ncbi:MAG: methionine--tRNA ligase subunit beta [Bacillota bacterium]|jgi:methionyl-tRNA synthetase|nr:methionine--tRNA ligase subunit beta [Candidatus Fermentithermobacillaceae bacterium]
MAETITLEEFKRVDLRVGEVVSCERVEGTDRLLKLTVDLGNETRQLVAGIAAHYEPRHLIGVQIVVVCNLKPAVIRGIESQGMLLAVQDGQVLGILTPERRVQNGSRVS